MNEKALKQAVKEPQPENKKAQASKGSELISLIKKQRDEKIERVLLLAAQRFQVRPGDINSLERAIKTDIELNNYNRDMKGRLKSWRSKEGEVKELYPGFDLNGSLRDRNFFSLLYKGLDPKSAYELIHRDEIIGAAMEYAIETLREKGLINTPTPERVKESALTESTPPEKRGSKLTKKERSQLIKRAERGERVVLD